MSNIHKDSERASERFSQVLACPVVLDKCVVVVVVRADGSRILEFADGLNVVICNTLFMKQESTLVTYVAGFAKSTVDYIMVRQGIKLRFVMSGSSQTKSACQSINC